MPVSDQGTLTGRYSLIPRTLIFLISGGRVLLLKGSPEKPRWAGLYNGIGGHIEPGEDVLSSAHRELKEETGLSRPGLWLCGVITVDTGKEVGIGLYVMRGECPGEIEITSTEGKLEWFDENQINQIPLVEDLHTLLPHVLAMHPGDPPFSAHYSYEENGELQISFYDSTSSSD